MQSLSLRAILTILFSFIVAIMLSIVPLPDWLEIFRPQWVALVLIYWVLAIPYRFGLGTAWLLGFLLDGLYGTLLGEHALALVVVAYLTNRFHRQIRMYPLLQQALVILVLMFIYQALLIWIQGVIGQLSHVYWFWVSAFTSMLFWPFVFMVLRSSRRHFNIS